MQKLNDRGVQVNHTTVMRWVHFYNYLLQILWKKKHKSGNKSWRMDETHLKIKGIWHYLYRAIDSDGLTLDFSLRKGYDFQSSYPFLERLINNYGQPYYLVTDKYGATLKAVRQLFKENHLIEQDHRLVKRAFSKSAGFQYFGHVRKTILGD